MSFFSSESSHAVYQMKREVGQAHTMVIYRKSGLGRVLEVLFNPEGDSCIA